MTASPHSAAHGKPGPAWATAARCLVLILSAAAFSACVAPSGRIVPLAPDRAEEDGPIANKRLVLKETYIAAVMAAEYLLPYGTYEPEGKDEDGIYFKAPIPIKKRGYLGGLFFPWTKGMLEGGIWTRKDDPCGSDAWLYFRTDNGEIRKDILPHNFRTGCGKYWNVQDLTALDARVAFVDGRPEGPYRLVHPSGAVQVAGAYEGGKREGVWSFWDSKGVKTIELTYRNGLREGPCRMWYSSFNPEPDVAGRRKLEVSFVSDKMHGAHVGWYMNGQTSCRIDLDQGEIAGAECWDEDGAPLSEFDAMRLARKQLGADEELFETIDETIEKSLAGASSAE